MPEDKKPVFLDSNILLYALGDEAEKREVAWTFLNDSSVISTQVINECSHVMIRKGMKPREEVESTLEDILSLVNVTDIGLPEIRLAWKLGQRYKYGHFDSLILASALNAGCGTLFSEDFQHGQVIDDNLTILNPFRTDVPLTT